MKALFPILILTACSMSPKAVTDQLHEFDGSHDTIVVGSGSTSLDGMANQQSGERDAAVPTHKRAGQDTSKAIANFVSVQRAGDVFVYLDGRRLRGQALVPDQPTAEKLAFALQEGRDRESMMMRMRVACSGGFEVCLDGIAYLYYEEKDQHGHCSASWYVTEASCK